MIEIRPRETVILADDFAAQVVWYRDVLGFRVTVNHEEQYHYCNLETSSGIRIGIGDAKEMGVAAPDRSNNTVLLQFEVDDVRQFLSYLGENGAATTMGPSYDEAGGFWFGGFSDPEGNPFWVVDCDCP